jgi:hypothetical protein
LHNRFNLCLNGTGSQQAHQCSNEDQFFEHVKMNTAFSKDRCVLLPDYTPLR